MNIGRDAFYGCKGLLSIIVEEGNTKYNSRNGCNAIIETATNTLIKGCINTVIPESITTIGYHGFAYVDFVSVDLPNSLTTISSEAFYGCSKLSAITIPESVTSIGDGAFYNCDNLKAVTLPESVTDIGERAFPYCYFVRVEGTTPIDIYANTFPNRKDATLYVPIGSKAAYEEADYWNEFKEISEEENVVNGIYYNLDKKNMTAVVTSPPNGGKYYGDIVIPSYIRCTNRTYSVTSIGESAFDCCLNISSIVIPDIVTSIKGKAFLGCCSLTSVILGNSVLSIGEYAFHGCNNLKSINIPESVTSISKRAFWECTSLSSISIPEGVTSIGEYAFVNCNNLKTVNIPESVTSISSGAFGYSGLTSIIIPNSVTSIGKAAFYECRSLSSVTIGNSVTAIGDFAFGQCRELSSVVIPNSVTSIGEFAFSGCKCLTSITMPESVRTIGPLAFNETLWYENQPDGLVYAGKVAYKYKGTLPYGTEIVIKDGTLGIAGEAFSNCSGLTSITIPGSMTTIGEKAFENCQKIIVNITDLAAWCNIYFVDSYSRCQGKLYLNGQEIKDLIIPEGVTSINNYAFAYCNGLSSVTIPKSVTTIGEYAFWDSFVPHIIVYIETPLQGECFKNLRTTLYVPNGCKTVYQAAPYWNDFATIREFPNQDVNQDNEVDVLDVVDLARFVVGNPPSSFDKFLADINIDYAVNLGDAVVLVNNIAGEQNFVKALSVPESVSGNDALMLAEANGSLLLCLDNERYYTAFQFDLYVPENADVSKMMLNAERKQQHQLLYNKVEDGHYRVAALSTSNCEFNGNDGELLNITLNGIGSDEVSVRNIHFFDANGQDYRFEDIEGANTTAISRPSSVPFFYGEEIFDLQGRKRSTLQRGVNIVGGKKVIVK